MILHGAPGEIAAGARTRVLAPLIDTRGGAETLRVIGAFRSAVGRTTDVVEQTRAGRLRADHFALRVRTARVRRARVTFVLRRWRHSADLEAVHEGVAGVTIGAAADGIVVHRQAVGVLSARTWTRVRALVADAGLVLRTLGADDTTRPASRRDPGEAWLTQAHRVSVLRPAIAVGSARRRVAGVDRRRQRRHVHQRATVHRVAGVTRQAGTRRRVIDDATRGALAAGARARIHALVVQTGLAAVAVGVGHAFRSAGDVRVAEVLRQASAGSDAVSLVAHGVRAARGRIARCGVSYGCNGFWGKQVDCF